MKYPCTNTFHHDLSKAMGKMQGNIRVGRWGMGRIERRGGVTKLRILTKFCGTAICSTPSKEAVCGDQPTDDLRDVQTCLITKTNQKPRYNESARQLMKIHLPSVFYDRLQHPVQRKQINTVCMHHQPAGLVRKPILSYSWVFSTRGVYKVCLFLLLYCDVSPNRFTLSTSGPSIAALVCAFYPRFPISSTDNR